MYLRGARRVAPQTALKMPWRNSLSLIGQTNKQMTSICFTITNCLIVRSCTLKHSINCKFMYLSGYWQWILANKRARISEYRKLLYGLLHDRERWTKSCAMIGYPSSEDGAILPARDYPPCPERKCFPKSHIIIFYWPSLLGLDDWILASFFLRVYGLRLRLGP